MNEEISMRLGAALTHARSAPTQIGRVDFLMQRPAEGEHLPVEELYFDVEEGIRGDRWKTSAWLACPDGRPDPRIQVSMTNTKVMRCYAGPAKDSIYACGDNLYVDFNITEQHLPAGALLQIGEVVLRVSDVVNDACGKFAQRFGVDAFRSIREAENVPFRLRGIFCSIVCSGLIRKGAGVFKVK